MDITEILAHLKSEFSDNNKYTFDVNRKFGKCGNNYNESSHEVGLTILKEGKYLMVVSCVETEDEQNRFFYICNLHRHEADYYVVFRSGKFYCKEKPYCKEASNEKNMRFSFGNVIPFERIDVVELDMNGIINLIRHSDESCNINKDDVCTHLRNCASKHNVNVSKWQDLLESIESNYGFNNNDLWLDYESEKNLIKLLLNEEDLPSTVYRYASLNALNRIFNDENSQCKHSMSSLVTMNDVTEVDYANCYLKRSGVDFSNHDLYRERQNSVHAYINSFSSLHDDLTLWRLYGDNAKGICIEYDTDSFDSKSDFILAYVSYADKFGKNVKLDFIAELMNTMVKGHHFRLRLWHIWQHFFKPYEYRVENEIRLLAFVDDLNFCINKYERKWVTTPNNIFTPLLILPLCQKNSSYFYPLSIKGVILGCKFVEKDVNRITWEYKIKDEHAACIHHDFHVRISNIDSYR